MIGSFHSVLVFFRSPTAEIVIPLLKRVRIYLQAWSMTRVVSARSGQLFMCSLSYLASTMTTLNLTMEVKKWKVLQNPIQKSGQSWGQVTKWPLSKLTILIFDQAHKLILPEGFLLYSLADFFCRQIAAGRRLPTLHMNQNTGQNGWEKESSRERLLIIKPAARQQV